MLMLCLDSSSMAATAAIIKDGELLCEYTQNQMKTHSVKMLPMIESMLSDVELSLSDIDVFACGIGPGSFTGLRIGVATVRGFAATLNKKVIGVNSLEVLKNNVAAFSGTIISLIWARENECYTSVFENGREVVPPCVLTNEEIVELAKDKNVLLVGDGAIKNADYFLEKLKNVKIAKGRENIISAASLGEVAKEKYDENGALPCESLSPLYLRKSQAEREYDEKHKNK